MEEYPKPVVATAPVEGTLIPSATGGRASQQEPAGEPHGALFLVLRYLRLQELLSFHRTCTLFRDALADDPSLWRDVVVEPPLSGKITDGVLVDVASRARGRLRTLALSNCWKITDAGLLRIVDENPGIVKDMQLHVPGCSYITADAVVKAAKTLAGQEERSLKQVRLNGVSHISKEHLDTLRSILGGENHHLRPYFYNDYWCSQTYNLYEDDRPIDVDICPKCLSLRLVFDCTRQTCRSTATGGIGDGVECRGCIFCIPRCGDCGGCVGLQELGEESACAHLLCLECWLRLPKCNTCNRPYCAKHRIASDMPNRGSGFICDECRRQDELPFQTEEWSV